MISKYGTMMKFILTQLTASYAFMESSISGLPASKLFVVSSDAPTTVQATVGSSPYIRWNYEDEEWKMETAVKRLRKGEQMVELHAQVHFGDSEYFDYYNGREFNSDFDYILYELLTDEDLLHKDRNGNLGLAPGRDGLSPVAPSTSDKVTAQSYGWTCQLDVINYSLPNWVHADLTRQELLSRLGPSRHSYDAPLWAQAQGQTNPVLQTATSAIFVGPPTPLLQQTSRVTRRLFTSLFLPGSSAANVIRACLWLNVPSPELSILLLDWSSLFRSDRCRTSLQLSPQTVPLLKALGRGRIDIVRKMVFGQVIITGSSKNIKASPDDDILIGQRNDKAIQILNGLLPVNRVALCYGCQHCVDLEVKLKNQGFQVDPKTKWRTAWSVSMPESRLDGLLTLLAPTLAYLTVSGADWVATWREWISTDNSGSEGIVLWLSYWIRHLLMYVGLSKLLLLDWRGHVGQQDNL